MTDETKDRCVHCTTEEAPAELHRCPICFKSFCNDHEHVMGGRRFCGQHCAEYFFFADPEDDEGD